MQFAIREARMKDFKGYRAPEPLSPERPAVSDLLVPLRPGERDRQGHGSGPHCAGIHRSAGIGWRRPLPQKKAISKRNSGSFPAWTICSRLYPMTTASSLPRCPTGDPYSYDADRRDQLVRDGCGSTPGRQAPL